MQNYNQQYDDLEKSWSEIYAQIEKICGQDQFNTIKDFKLNSEFIQGLEAAFKVLADHDNENLQLENTQTTGETDLKTKDLILSSLQKFITNTSKIYNNFVKDLDSLTSELSEVNSNISLEDILLLSNILQDCKFINDIKSSKNQEIFKDLFAIFDALKTAEETQSTTASDTTSRNDEETATFQELLAGEIIRLTLEEEPTTLVGNNIDINTLGSEERFAYL